MQSCPGETCAAQRHRGQTGADPASEGAAGTEPIPSRSSTRGDATTSRLGVLQSRGTAVPPPMALVEPLWCWQMVLNLGWVVRARAGASAAGRAECWGWGGNGGDGAPSSSSAAFQALRVSWCCLVAATALSAFAGLWDSSVLFSSCSSGHLHLLGSCPAALHRHQPVQRVRTRPPG